MTCPHTPDMMLPAMDTTRSTAAKTRKSARGRGREREDSIVYVSFLYLCVCVRGNVREEGENAGLCVVCASLLRARTSGFNTKM